MPIDNGVSFIPTRNKPIIFTGGLNTSVSDLEMPPGDLCDCMNIMEVDGVSHGYTSVEGYEAYSGEEQTVRGDTITLPSEVELEYINTWVTATVYYVNDRVLVGSYVYVCISSHTASTGVNEPDGTPGDNTWWTYEGLNSVVDTFKDVNREAVRANITTVTGSGATGEGKVKWVDQYDEEVYAWRKIESTAYDGLWKESSTGWDLMSSNLLAASTYSSVVARFSEFEGNDKCLFWVNGVSNYVYYTKGVSGTYYYFEGPPDAEGAPLHIAVFKNRIMLAYPDGHLFFSTVGLYGTTTATDKLYFDEGTIEFNVGESIAEGSNTADITGVKKLSGEWKNGDAAGVLFINNLSTPCTFVDNNTVAETTNTPFGSAKCNGTQLSVSVWDGGLGAGEILVGENITGIQEAPGGVFVIFKEKGIDILYYEGTYTATGDSFIYRLENFSERSGCYLQSNQRLLGSLFFADDRGITNLNAVQAFGDFSSNAISKKVQEYYLSKKNDITATVVHRDYNQYRIFFGAYALYFTFSGEELRGATKVRLDHWVVCTTEEEDENGDVAIYFGTNDGYVMKMDSGTSFNGDEILTHIKTSYYHYLTPRNWKRFLRVFFEITADNGTIFSIKPIYNYKDPRLPGNQAEDYVGKGIGGIWGTSLWDQFIYGGAQVDSAMMYLTGVGTNMSIEIRTSEKYTTQFTIHDMITDYQLMGTQY